MSARNSTMRSDSALDGSMPFGTSSENDNLHPLNGSNSAMVSGESGSGVSEDATDRSSLGNNLEHPMIVYAPETRTILQDQTDEVGIQGSQDPLDSSNAGVRHRRTQDNAVNDHSTNGVVELYDEHSGLSLDVDDMSFEELLAVLEEQTWDVGSGLSEREISHSMFVWMYGGIEPSPDSDMCCICQEVINTREIGAALYNCFHEFHRDCITNWLLVKNACPICRTIAV